MALALDGFLEVAGVVRTFGGIRAVDSITFSVPKATVFGVIGPNGAGKTVLLNLISGVYSIEDGSIHMAGRRIDSLRPHRVAALRVARTFQSTEQFKEFRVADYVMLGRLSHQPHSIFASTLSLPHVRRAERAERLSAIGTLERLGLEHVANERMAELPYGVQKQIDIARVIASEPVLMLLDEPTSGTTSEERESISEALAELAKTEVTLVVVDHDVRFISRHCESVLVMNYGQLLATGTPNEVLAKPEVVEAYLGI